MNGKGIPRKGGRPETITNFIGLEIRLPLPSPWQRKITEIDKDSYSDYYKEHSQITTSAQTSTDQSEHSNVPLINYKTLGILILQLLYSI